MVAVTVFLSLISLCFANAQQDIPINLKPFSITPEDFFKSHFLQPDYVNGAVDCGGPGRTLQFTHTNCVPALPAVPCIAEINKVGKGTMYFVAGEDASDVLVRASIITSDGNVKSSEFPIPDIRLKAGQAFAVHALGNPQPELLGKLFTGRVEIIRASDKSVQACSEIDFIVYKG